MWLSGCSTTGAMLAFPSFCTTACPVYKTDTCKLHHMHAADSSGSHSMRMPGLQPHCHL
jgi:hypothetical protein